MDYPGERIGPSLEALRADEANVTTIQDVAKAASVSAATVSRVLNGNPSVAADLAERVQMAAAELGYRPNVFAKGLRTRSTTVIGLIVSDIENPFHTSIARGAEDAAQERKYSVLLCNSDEDLEKEARYLQVLLDQKVAGVIIEPVSERRTDVGELLTLGIPVVAVDRSVAARSIDTVTVNNVLGARRATEALLAEGRRRVGLISGPPGRTTADERLRGYQEAMNSAGHQFDDRLIVNGKYRTDGGYEATDRLLSMAKPPDALFVANNLMAAGALQALTDRGLTVPDDIGFASFDEPAWAYGGHVPRCAVHQPGREMGRLASQLLLDRIAGDDGPIRHVVLDPEIREPGTVRRPLSMDRARARSTASEPKRRAR